MVNKKAQGAMEFLMTYGWAILIVIVAVASLAYFGVFRASEILPTNCVLIPGLSCEEFRVVSNGVDIIVRNGMGINLENVIITLVDSPCTNFQSSALDLKDGEVKTFSIACPIGNIQRYKSRLSLSYRPSGYTLDHIAKGEINGKVESGTITIVTPSAPTITNGPTESVTDVTATIIWTTDQASNSSVDSSGPDVGDNIEVTSHSKTLTGLTPNTFYSYTVTSCNLTTRNCTSGSDSFTTLPTAVQDTTPPSVTLNSPTQFQNFSSTLITFNCNANDAINLTNVTLRGNWSGSWQNIQTQTATSNNYNAIFNNINVPNPITPGLQYGWNCRAYDNSTNLGNSANDGLFGIDNSTPLITNVQNISITNVSVEIRWDTSEPANSTVRYGTTLSLTGGISWSSSYDGFRIINIAGLTPNTLYYYNVTSCDSAGNCRTNEVGVRSYNFTTLANPPPPGVPWWNSNYQYRKQINVTNNMGSTLFAGNPVNVVFDHANLVGGGKSLSNGNDIRIVYYNGATNTELDRFNDNGFNLATTSLWFKLQANIPASSTNSGYWMYYGNSSATSPPANGNNIFWFFDNFNSLDATKWSSSGVIVSGGAADITGYLTSLKEARNNQIFESRTLLTINTVNNDPTWWLGFQCTSPSPDCLSAPWILFVKRTNPGAILPEHNDGTTNSAGPATSINANQYYLFTIKWRYSNEVIWQLDRSNIHTYSTGIINSPLSAKYKSYNYPGGIIRTDWVFMANYTYPEPTYVFSGESP